MINTNEAIDKITEIYHQLSKTTIYRGYKPIVVAISGILGIIASIVQPFFINDYFSIYSVIYWVSIATFNLILCTSMILYQYFFKENYQERQKTVCIMIQFIPMIIAGTIITTFFIFNGDLTLPLLPGIWALIFSMGIFNVRPHLSNLTLIPAFYYLLCSLMLFWFKFYNIGLLSFGMGTTFGLGQLISALTLYWSIEKINNER